jgi:hypothetical protein
MSLSVVKKIFGIGSALCGLAFVGMTVGYLVKGDKDQTDDGTLQVVSIDHNPSAADGDVSLLLNPGVPDAVSLKVQNVMSTDGCSLALSYVLPEQLPDLASYLSVSLSDGTQELYSGLVKDASSERFVPAYPLSEGKDVTFVFTYLLDQAYPASGESFDFSLHLESRALVYGH